MEFNPDFLRIADVLQIHADQIELYGGFHGLRDEGLLASAIAQPMGGVGEDYFHPDLPSMAAAYVFHIVKNHPFLDGNKRAGFAAATTFLDLNDHELDSDDAADYDMVLAIAEGRLSKDEVIAWWRQRVIVRTR